MKKVNYLQVQIDDGSAGLIPSPWFTNNTYILRILWGVCKIHRKYSCSKMNDSSIYTILHHAPSVQNGVLTSGKVNYFSADKNLSNNRKRVVTHVFITQVP